MIPAQQPKEQIILNKGKDDTLTLLSCDNRSEKCPENCIHKIPHLIKECNGLCPIDKRSQLCCPIPRPHPAPPAPEVVWRCCEFLPRAIDRKPEDCEMVKQKARQAREEYEKELLLFCDEQFKDIKRTSDGPASLLRNVQVKLFKLKIESLRGDHP